MTQIRRLSNIIIKNDTEHIKDNSEKHWDKTSVTTAQNEEAVEEIVFSQEDQRKAHVLPKILPGD